ncbi:hypothetical protein pdam_00007546, partial [Pocillopora damicornis]
CVCVGIWKQGKSSSWLTDYLNNRAQVTVVNFNQWEELRPIFVYYDMLEAVTSGISTCMLTILQFTASDLPLIKHVTH